jgi:N-acetylmuramoyl-L-alanine amidase
MMRTDLIASLFLASALSGCGGTRAATPAATPRPVAERSPAYCSAQDCAQRWGMSLRQEADSRRAILSNASRELVCCAGLRSALVDGVPMRLDFPAELMNGQFMLPAPLVAAVERAWAARPAPPRPAASPFRIVIDAGHGGTLTGAQGVQGTLEKDVNLSIAKDLKAILEAKGVEVVMLRDSDRSFFHPSLERASYREQQISDLAERVRLANRARPDLFVSLHANWAPSADAEGFEVYYPRSPDTLPPLPARPSKRSPFDWSAYGSETPRILDRLSGGNREDIRWRACRDLAETVRRSLRGALSTPDRGERMSDFKVIRESSAPAILVEAGFLSNPDEERRLSSRDYQKRLAQALADAILQFQARRAKP